MRAYEEAIEDVLSIGSTADQGGPEGGEPADQQSPVQPGLQGLADALRREQDVVRSRLRETLLEAAEGVPVSSGLSPAPRDWQLHPAPKPEEEKNR